MRWLRHLWRCISSDTSEDPLPMEAIAAAAAGSAAALALGWLLSAWDFLLNILASVALMGPGLIATNVLARNWRRRRRNEEVLSRIEGPLSAVISVVEGSLNRFQQALPELKQVELERSTTVEVDASLRMRIDVAIARSRAMLEVCESLWLTDTLSPMYPYALRRSHVREIIRILDEISGTIRTSLVNTRLQEIHEIITAIQERDNSAHNHIRFLRCLIDALSFLALEVPSGTANRPELDTLRREALERLWSADNGPNSAWVIELDQNVVAREVHGEMTAPPPQANASLPKSLHAPEGSRTLVLGPRLSEVAMAVLRRHDLMPDAEGRVSFSERPEARGDLLEALERHG